MKLNRTKNAGRNIIWGVLERIVSIILPFISRTLLIQILGAEYLGLNSLFSSILSVLSISELGFGTAIVFSMYEPIAHDDKDTICALLNTYRKIYIAVGTFILSVGVILIPFLPKLIKGDVPADINLYILYSVHLFDTVIGYYLFSYKAALFSAYQRNDLVSKRKTFFGLIGSILRIALLLSIKNYYAYVFVLPVITIGTNLANAYLAKKLFPELNCRGDISAEQKNNIRKRIIGLISFKIYNVVFNSVDTIVISAYLGLTKLAIYNNYYYILTSITGFLSILSSAITAGIGNKMITNSVDENYSDFKNIIFANGWICSWCAVCLVCLYQHFMMFWVGEKLMFPFHTMILMVLYFFLPRISSITYTYREAAGLWWEDRFRPIIATVVNLTVNIILVRIIGMNGVIISTLLCTIFINVPWGSVVLFKNYFKRSPLEYFRLLLYYTAITAIVSAASYVLCSFLPSEGFLPLACKCVLCVFIPNVLFYLVYFRKTEFRYTLILLNRLFPQTIIGRKRV